MASVSCDLVTGELQSYRKQPMHTHFINSFCNFVIILYLFSLNKNLSLMEISYFLRKSFIKFSFYRIHLRSPSGHGSYFMWAAPQLTHARNHLFSKSGLMQGLQLPGPLRQREGNAQYLFRHEPNHRQIHLPPRKFLWLPPTADFLHRNSSNERGQCSGGGASARN